jgi:dihydroxyacetone kinase
LGQVTNTARLVADNLVSVGASLSHVHVPGRTVDDPGTGLKDDEIELGMGIHNEDGSERLGGGSTDLPALVRKMLAQLLDLTDLDRAFLEITSVDDVVLLINNLGGVSPLELGGIVAEVVGQLKGTYGLRLRRVLAGTYMTSLNGLGFSISILRTRDTGLGKGRSMLELLDAPAEAVGWPAAVRSATWKFKSCAEGEVEIKDVEAKPSNLKSKFLKGVYQRLCVAKSCMQSIMRQLARHSPLPSGI